MRSDLADGTAGCRVRFEVAVSDFERFLLALYPEFRSSWAHERDRI
jgi:hypothetical protein